MSPVLTWTWITFLASGAALLGQNKGPYRIGAGVSAPVPIYKPEPEYAEEARKAKLQGTVVLFVVVDDTGKASEIKVIRPLGLGLDQKAVEAIRKWRFRPGMKDGRPVAVQATIEINFRLLDFPWPGGEPRGWSIMNEQFDVTEGTQTPTLLAAPSNLLPRPSQNSFFALDLVISAEGHPEDVLLTGPTSPDADAVASQVRQWRFDPAKRDGLEVAIHARIALNFTPAK